MASPGEKGQFKFYISGQQLDAPVEWQDIEILATFDNESQQANITTEQFTFVLDEASEIAQHIENGMSGGVGIFEGLPFEITTFNALSSFNSFKGYLDLSDEFEELQAAGKVKAKIKKAGGLNALEDRLSALTYGYLKEKLIFTNSDYLEIDYVVEKKINAFEILVSAVMLYLMVKELVEFTRHVIEKLGSIIADAQWSAINAIAFAVASILYAALIVVAILDMSNKLIATFIPPKRKAKVLNLHSALSKVVAFLGYAFETTITDLSEVYYLPSNPRLDDIDSEGFVQFTKGTPNGIPWVSDPGYGVIEMFTLAREMFNAKIAIIDNVLHFKPKDDPFWTQTATWTMPSIQLPIKRYNTSDLIANRFLAFDTDLNDEWTIDNWQGTNYEIITDARTVQNADAKYIRGLENINFPVCLGNRKDKLNPFEKFLAVVAGGFDAILSIFGNGTSLASKIEGKVGLLKVTKNNYTKPKLLRLTSDGKLATNHRDNWSAKYLYDKYHIEKSFVENNYHGQKEVYREVKIPFGFRDFLQLINNSYFTNFDGRQGKFEKLSWKMDADYAIVDFWIRQPYTKNLKETFIEPS